MSVKLRISKNSKAFRILKNPWGRAFVVAVLLIGMTAAGVFSYYYFQYSRMIDAELRAGVFSNATLLYAAPRPVLVGEDISQDDIAAYLRRCGYSSSNTNHMGWYQVRADGVEVNPGPDAYDPEGAVIKIAGGQVTQIISLRDHTERTQYLLEPELISNLYDKKREKRRIVAFADIPQGDGECAAGGRGQAFLPARRLRSGRDHARSLARLAGRQTPGRRFDPHAATGAHACGSAPSAGGGARSPKR